MGKFRFLILCLFLSGIADAQYFAFHKNDSVPAGENSDTLLYAWAGGLNYGQFSAIDLDYDGDLDFLAFDRTGNRVMCFENHGTGNQIDYSVADRFRAAFPPVHDWILLMDYDGDGKEDIFTYNSGGVRVFRNTGNQANGLQFQEVKFQLYSDYHPGVAVLYISLADIPAITDVDNDSDLDILTFSTSGGCVEWHRNMSVELYGHRDSLIFERAADNWGNFTEGAMSNDIHLADSCDSVRHTGSSLLAMDTDGDMDKDLVLGDIGGLNLVHLRNDGTPNVANMGAFYTSFPSQNSSTLPVSLSLFPAAFYVDINNDSRRDLLVAPNAPSSSETFAGTWYYRNDGTDAIPNFKYQENDFLQGEMLEFGDGAFPRFFDYDRDGLIDLAIGNANYWAGVGQVALYKNTGTATAPSFELVTRDLGSVSTQNYKNIIPTFGDMDGDGDVDMIIGEITGYIHYYQNTAPVAPNSPANFVLTSTQYFNIKENSFSAPVIVDLDLDGVNDIVCGSRLGKLNFYKNTGTVASANFSPVATTTLLGGVNVVDPTLSTSGYSVPEFFTHNGKVELFVGSLRGTISHYTDIYDGANQLQPAFTLQTDQLNYLVCGTRVSPAVYNLNQDSYPDLAVGNYSGGVELYYGEFTTAGLPEISGDKQFILYPNPVQNELRIGSDFDQEELEIVVADVSGRTLRKISNYQLQQPVDVSGWQNGFYIFTIWSKHRQVASFRVIKIN